MLNKLSDLPITRSSHTHEHYVRAVINIMNYLVHIISTYVRTDVRLGIPMYKYTTHSRYRRGHIIFPPTHVGTCDRCFRTVIK